MIELTYDQRLELAARELCRVRGQDPDEMTSFNDGSNSLVYRSRNRWKSVVEELKQEVIMYNTLVNFSLI